MRLQSKNHRAQKTISIDAHFNSLLRNRDVKSEDESSHFEASSLLFHEFDASRGLRRSKKNSVFEMKESKKLIE